MSTQLFLTSGTSWTVPSDWNNSSNTIEVVGAGGTSGTASGVGGWGGAGGGGYAKAVNMSLTAGATITYAVGASGSDTYFNGASLGVATIGCASGGSSTSATGATGSTGVGGSLQYKGGDGGTSTSTGGSGGGGAAGPFGIGAPGSASTSSTGADGGTADNGHGSAGGHLNNPVSGGTEFDGSHGCGGGSGGASAESNPVTGGAYGGGSGGSANGRTGASGYQGLIVITYTSIFTSPQYWVGGTGNWDASTTTNWSTTSGGSGGASVPTSSNDVVFDFNSGAGTITITATANARTVNFNGFTQTLSMGAQTLNIGGAGIVWNPITTAFTLTPATSTIEISEATSATKTFNGQGLIYHNLYITGVGTGTYIIQGSNTFADFKVDTPPHIVQFTAGTTQTLTTFTVSGTAGNLMTLQSTTSGQPWYLHRATTGTISCDYLSLQDSHVS